MRVHLVLALVMLSLSSCVTLARQNGAVTEVKKDAEVQGPSKNNDEDDGVSISIADDEKLSQANGDDVFIPTKEWKTVKPGQAIPKGLHVRMNIQTGKKEAKLMDGDDGSRYQKLTKKPDSSSGDDADASTAGVENGQGKEKGRLVRMKEALEDAMRELEEGKQPESDSEKEESLKYWKHGDKQGMLNKNKKHFTRQELKEALKKFKAKRDDVTDEQRIAESAKKKFRKIEDLKKDFEQMNMHLKTDMEIMTELLKRYNRAGISAAEKKNILTDFEYYVHQIDNAQDFADMGGLGAVIKDLNHTDEMVRSEAAFVLGSAMQSNPKVQISGVEGGAVQVLIRMLSTEASVKVRNRVMYALSSLIRHFPYAQQRFLQLGGLQALSNLFSQQGTEKIRVKAVTLVHDLLTERALTEKHSDPKDSTQQEKIRQYQKVPLLPGILEQGWCDLIPTLLSMPEHDTREKVLSAMDSLVDSCRPNFIKAQLSLSQLKTEYEKLSQEELRDDGEDLYYGGLLKIVENMITKLRTKDEL